MTPELLLRLTINPVLQWMENEVGVKSDDRARLMLLTIAQQESGIAYRRQVGGPAVSWWQFESGGGVKGVLNHASTKDKIARICSVLAVPATQAEVYAAMPHNDLLACAMARLLLFTDPKSLPQPDDVNGGWDYYNRNWRPGKPHPDKWPAYWKISRGVVVV